MVARAIALLLLLAAAATSIPAAAAVSAQLSATRIDELETVLLTIKITETRQSQTLDLSALESDFHIMTTNTVSQSRFLNGRGQSWVDYQITLQPKRTGTLTIPGIAVGNERTPTLELKVQPLSSQTRRKIDELVFFENAVSASTIYVQSQLILTRRLLYSQGVQLYSDLPGAPAIADAVVLTLGETSSGTTERNGRTYGMVEQQYAIFPETSGTFTLPGISITASVRLREGNRVSRKGVRVGTDEERIVVLPVPPEYPADQPWLPAQNVILHDEISPRRNVYKVGETLTHELLIHVEGNIGSISPPLPLELNDNEFRIYPQAPVIEDDTTVDTVKGSRLQTKSIVPLQPGLLTLPATQIVWWDTLNEEVRITKTNSRTLSITGQAVAQTPIVATPAADAEDAGIAASDNPLARMTWQTLLPYLSGLLGLVAVGACMFVLYRYRGLWRMMTLPQAGARGKLRQAFKTQDPRQIHNALGAYLADFYGCPRHEALTRFSAHSEATAAAVAHLREHLFKADAPQSANSLPDVQELQALQTAVARLRQIRSTRQVNTTLPDLYPAPGAR